MTHFEDIDSTLISLGEPEHKKAGVVNYTVVPILCGGKPLTMRVPGRLEIYDHGPTFSIGLSVDDTNCEMFKEIEDKIRKETKALVNHPAVPEFKQREFKLIRTSAYWDFPRVYSKLYTAKNGRIIAKFYEKVAHGSKATPPAQTAPRPKKRVIPDPRKLVGVPFDGEIILQLQRLHLALPGGDESVKSIVVAAREVLVTKIIRESFFDELSDDE